MPFILCNNIAVSNLFFYIDKHYLEQQNFKIEKGIDKKFDDPRFENAELLRVWQKHREETKKKD